MFPLYGSLSPLAAWLNKTGLVFLFRDEYTTPEAAPLTTPRTNEPGPGTTVFTDPNNNAFSISSGKLIVGGIFVASLRSGSSFSVQAGKGFFAKWDSLFRVEYILNISTIFTYNGIGGWERTGSGQLNRVNPGRWDGIHDGSPAVYGIILRDGGGCYFTKDTRLIRVTSNPSSTPHYINITAGGTLDYLRACQMSAPWDTQWGLATNYYLSAPGGQVTTSEANAENEVIWTPNAGEIQDFMIRRTDDNNCWIVRCDQANSTVKLIQKQSGVETERSSAAQTWTPSTAYEILAQQDGNNIKTWVAGVAKNTYANAAFNNSATGVKITLAGTNLICWPLDLTGTALTELQKWIA
jgi:hypothetical protein